MEVLGNLYLNFVESDGIAEFQAMIFEGNRLYWVMLAAQEFPGLNGFCCAERGFKHWNDMLTLYKSV